jgi:flagellar motility protein MotE (MotC chaperone)
MADEPIKEAKKTNSKNGKDIKNDKDGKSGKGGIVFIIIVVVLIGFIALVKLDVFGLGTNVLGPALKDVPVLNLILPEMPEEEVEVEVLVNYTFETIEDAIKVIKERDLTLMEMTEEAEIINEQYSALIDENDRLKIFEDRQAQFEEDRKEFDLLVAEYADASEYMDFVESAYTENALIIYESLVQEKVFSEQVMVNAAMYASMNAEDAAEIMEITHLTDIDMVAEILLSLDATKAGAILAELDPTTADRISRYMYPSE